MEGIASPFSQLLTTHTSLVLKLMKHSSSNPKRTTSQNLLKGHNLASGNMLINRKFKADKDTKRSLQSFEMNLPGTEKSFCLKYETVACSKDIFLVL